MVSTLEALERYPVPPSTAKLMTRGNRLNVEIVSDLQKVLRSCHYFIWGYTDWEWSEPEMEESSSEGPKVALHFL